MNRSRYFMQQGSVFFLLISHILLSLSQQTSAETSQALTAPDETSSSIANQLPDAAVSENDPEFYKRLYDFGLGKRAYSYVSEYKRLPVYNFGLGKRARSYNFGLGKRRQYSFGLGKRPVDYEDYYSNEEDNDISDEELNDDEDAEEVSKRTKMYSFGLGKRGKPYSFGLGKREPGRHQSLYSFGLGKRADHSSMYSFGLGKRADGRLYAFGLGKRPVTEDGRRFSFGLGKRSEEQENEIEEPMYDDDKRAQHRFAFGLGKREVSAKDLDAIKTEEDQLHEANTHNKETKNLDEGSMQSGKENHEIKKRSLHYPLAISKRGAYSYGGDVNEDYDDGVQFSRLIRKPYSFGLGKRIPMYDFGIGKRSERK